MIQLSLTPAEVAMLRDVLTTYLSELHMEIADTDAHDYREQLKEEEAFLKRLLRQLGTSG